MINPKSIVGAAFVGFILSCFAGFVGGAGFLTILLRAVFFAAVFGGLAVGINVVFSNYLDLSTTDIASSVDKSEPAMAKSTGSAVDITIAGENLPEDAQEPIFQVTKTVKDYHGATNDEKVSGEASNSMSNDFPDKNKIKDDSDTVSNKKATAVLDVNETVPLQEVQEKPQSMDLSSRAVVQERSFENMQNDNAEKSSGNSEVRRPSSDESELDDLPDLTDLVDNAVSESGGTIEDSDFAVSAKRDTTRSGSERELPNSLKDTATLAKAIETVMLKDN